MELAEATSRCYIAIDRTEWSEVEQLAERLAGSGCGLKVGMELYYAHGPKVVEFLVKKGFPIFLDLKLHDIPNTVGHALTNLLKLPITLTNVHAAGGAKMLASAQEARLKTAPQVKLIAVTVLTSFAQQDVASDLQSPKTIQEMAIHWGKLVKAAGLDGVVCSPLEAATLKNEVGNNLLTVTPGIRAKGANLHDQQRVLTAKEAFENGCDNLVIGRAVTGAQDPKAALYELLQG